jgi:MFS superfamily sulfate permease-like transporter
VRPNKNNSERSAWVLKDALIIILLFVSFCYIGVDAAAYVAVICTALLLMRRIIVDYSPGFIKVPHNNYNKKDLIVPKGVEIFDLNNLPSMEYLYTYTELRPGIDPASVLVMRFTGIFLIRQFELDVVIEVIRRLRKRKIIIIFADVSENLRHQFRQYEIEKKVGSENIFYSITDALVQAGKALKDT